MFKKKIGFMLSISLLLLSSFIAFSCSGNSVGIKSVNAIGYTLTEPDKTIILPGILREISGLTVIDSSSVACIQDEKGVVYIFDVLNDEIRKEIYFNSDGDYEAICRVDQTLYVLRSDGVLFKISNYKSSSFAEKIKLKGIYTADNEGLCYDPVNRRLLIAPKSKPEKGSGFRGDHIIYGFDLSSQSLLKKPVIEIDLAAVKRFLAEKQDILLKKNKKKVKKYLPEINFKPSDICIHPVTHKLYVLSGEERTLYVFNTDGTIEYAEKLDPYIFNMPEGIAFFGNGDMLISNEAGNRYPTILIFNYKNK
jgi:uncharacterized protein YjiK